MLLIIKSKYRGFCLNYKYAFSINFIIPSDIVINECTAGTISHDQNYRVHISKDLNKEGNVLFNDVLNTFYLRLYGVRHMVKDHSDSALQLV